MAKGTAHVQPCQTSDPEQRRARPTRASVEGPVAGCGHPQLGVVDKVCVSHTCLPSDSKRAGVCPDMCHGLAPTHPGSTTSFLPQDHRLSDPTPLNFVSQSAEHWEEVPS